jgi:hypothetical protein
MGLEVILIQKRIICPLSQFSAHRFDNTTNLTARKTRIDYVQSALFIMAGPF